MERNICYHEGKQWGEHFPGCTHPNLNFSSLAGAGARSIYPIGFEIHRVDSVETYNGEY